MARGKKGQVLLLALMIMFVGAIILTGLFQYLGTSLLLATRGEENAVNYYAADSGIEDALYSLMNNQSYEQRDYPLNYSNSGMNNRVVNVSIVNNPEGLGNTTYKVTSTATHNKSGESTIIESYVRATPIKFWEFGKDAITSNCSVTIQKGTNPLVNGSVTYVCDGGLVCPGDQCPPDPQPGDPPCCHILPPSLPHQDADGIDWWPETWAIKEYFKDQVENGAHITADETGVVRINMADPSYASLGPLYVDGNLELYSSVDLASTSLAGVVYVTGDLTINDNTRFTLNLSNQVIFVENEDAIIGDSIGTGHADVLIESEVKKTGAWTKGIAFAGSGAIFAIGDIWFQPKMSTSPEEFLFVMSLEGWVNIQPGGNFFGSIAGNVHVDINPNSQITRTEGGDLWDTFFNPEPVISKIITYDIIDR